MYYLECKSKNKSVDVQYRCIFSNMSNFDWLIPQMQNPLVLTDMDVEWKI